MFAKADKDGDGKLIGFGKVNRKVWSILIVSDLFERKREKPEAFYKGFVPRKCETHDRGFWFSLWMTTADHQTPVI